MTPPQHDESAIPHVDRTVTHVDRTVLAAAPEEVHRSLLDLADLLAERSDLRIESWPDGGISHAGASFWAVHHRMPTGGHAVSYEVTDVGPAAHLELQARSDLFAAAHRIEVATAADGTCEVAWSVTVQPAEATTHQMLQDASVLASAALEELEKRWAVATPDAAPGTTEADAPVDARPAPA